METQECVSTEQGFILLGVATLSVIKLLRLLCNLLHRYSISVSSTGSQDIKLINRQLPGSTSKEAKKWTGK